MEHLSEDELYELCNTKYVTKIENFDSDCSIETARSVDSFTQNEPLFMPTLTTTTTTNVGQKTDSVDELVEKFLNSPFLEDEAVVLLTRLQTASRQQLKNSDIWKNCYSQSMDWNETSRLSELELVNYLIRSSNSRPSVLHINCKRLIELDVSNTIQKCLTIHPTVSENSLLRVSIKTDMPFKQLLGQLDLLAKNTPGFRVQKGLVTAILKQDNTVHKLITPEYSSYANLEYLLAIPGMQAMSSSVRIKCTIDNNPSVRVNVVFHNDPSRYRGRRMKIIDIEQTVWPKTRTYRHVTFAPKEQNIIHEYEISDNVPFIPLARSKKQIIDLLKYLENLKATLDSTTTTC